MKKSFTFLVAALSIATAASAQSTVTFTGSPSQTAYQWYNGTPTTGTAISGATSSTYSASATGPYYVVYNNVTASGLFVALKSSQASGGGAYPLTIDATANYPSGTYQWQSSTNNSTYSNISGATAVQYVVASGSGTYYRLVNTSNGYTYTSDGTYVGSASSILPVALISFTATPTGSCGILLQWASASEANSNLYVVEHGTDGSNFAEAGSLTSKNSPTGAAYSYSFNGSVPGTNYFRLRMVDRDGSSVYSAMATAVSNCGSGVSVAQSGGSITIKGLTAASKIAVYNLLGQKLLEANTIGTTYTLDTQGLAKGTYILKASSGNHVLLTQKIVSQ